ncbi:MAG: YceI family protein [Fulvivirga sp.]
MKNFKFLAFAASVALITACSQQKEGTDAEVSEAKEVNTVENAQKYAINVSESTISWIGSKPAGKHNGTIPINSGNIAITGNEVTGGKILMNVNEIKNNDLVGDEEMQLKLVNHLKSADFFDAENHPTAEFVITSVEPFGKDDSVKIKEEYETKFKPASATEHVVEAPTHTVTGNLTMRGKTLSVSFPAHVKVENNKVTAKAKFNIDRTLWGLQYGDEADAVDKAKDKFIYNTVNVGFDIVASEDPAI